jgi:anti-sigma28 factor (negative regulator of flagellin synthesis)
MISISALTPSVAVDGQFYKAPSFGKDTAFIDDPYADKVSLSGTEQNQPLTYQHLAKANQTAKADQDNSSQPTQQNSGIKDSDPLAKMMQQILDAKLGMDRKKLEEIDQKIEALLSKEGELSSAEQSQLELLQKQKEQFIKDGAKKLTNEAS